MTEKMNIIIPKNNSIFIILILVFLLFSVVLYAFPLLFIFLFNNILGNLLLIAGIIVVGMMDFRMAIGLAAIFIILYQAFSLSKKSGSSTLEGFTEWSADLKNKFLKFENTYNPNIQFDINIIQQQASPEEVEYLLKNNKWPWSESVKTMYQDAIMRNSMISIDPGVAMDVAQTIYNETAVKELLSWNTKEGVFLLSGVTIGHTDGLPDNVNNIVRCGNNDDGDAVMEKIVNVGYDGINGSMIQNITPVNNADIPTLVDGFKFLKEDCNPCLALNDPANYSCPFSLNVGDGGEVSSVWKNLWGLNDSYNSNNNSNNSKKDFPLLNELKNELDNAFISLQDNNSTTNTSSTNTSSTNDNIQSVTPFEDSNM